VRESITRDFIYLDVERVRSIVAQNAGGLASERKSEAQHTAGGKTSGEGGLPFIAKVGGEADYHYMRSRSETLSLHDYIFSEFVRLLGDADDLIGLNVPDKGDWVEDNFADGNFMIVPGVIKVMDYQYAMEFMKAAPDLHKITTKLSTPVQTQSSNTRTSSGRVATQNTQANPFANQPIKEVATLVDQFYRDLVRVKVFPYPEEPKKVFVGSADKTMFRYSPSALMNMYGPVIDAGWVSVLQVNRGVRHNAGELVSETGNAMEDILEGFTDYVTQMYNMMQGVKFPSVSVTPIAIYREIYLALP
jgi:hypothetical protein